MCPYTIKKTILIVENNTLIAKDLREIAEEMGHLVIDTVPTVSQAKAYIDTTSLDLVLIDINLGDHEDGVSLGEYLLKKDAVPYMYITGACSPDVLDRVKETRPYGYLVKPYKKIDVEASITIILNNFIHRKIDVQRQKDENISEIPFILKKAIEFIDANIYEKIDINDVVAKTNWSYTHFLRVFKEYVGMSPYQYVLQKKIKKALAQLVETNLPISQIGYNLGFESHGTFSNTFKKIAGQTPESYRKQKAVENNFLK